MMDNRMLIPWVTADARRIGRDILQNWFDIVTQNVCRIKASFHPQVTQRLPFNKHLYNSFTTHLNYGSTTLYITVKVATQQMTKFFLEKTAVRKAPADYRIISYFKILECVKKVRLFTIQKLVRQLKKLESPSDSSKEEALKAIKTCHPDSVRKIVVYLLREVLNFNLEKFERFFQTKVGCKVEQAVAAIEEAEKSQTGERILLSAVKKHPSFEQVQDQIQLILGKVEKKMTQTKQKKEVKKAKLKIKKQTQKKEQVKAKEIESEDEVIKSGEIVQQQQVQQQRPKPAKKVYRGVLPTVQPEMDVEETKPKIKTRYDRKPQQPRSEFKKTGRNRYLNEKKGKDRQQASKPEQPAVNKYLNPNQSTHPSWQAKLQQSKIVPFEGKRIVFT